ncbi:hypothetical protein AGOR_G00225450 [Albula goreensis]|uniref:Uncharacterized protein n=1 Tax=Albula goreensis TaxID=1534307 RepID=A0A8T3CMG9_9TELE|nr:hypothetical protein AGOR_G00225450 [Albula goreensis]
MRNPGPHRQRRGSIREPPLMQGEGPACSDIRIVLVVRHGEKKSALNCGVNRGELHFTSIFPCIMLSTVGPKRKSNGKNHIPEKKKSRESAGSTGLRIVLVAPAFRRSPVEPPFPARTPTLSPLSDINLPVPLALTWDQDTLGEIRLRWLVDFTAPLISWLLHHFEL